MRRAALSLALLGLLAFGAGAAPAPAQEPEQTQVSVTPAGVSQFPERSYRLALPERRGLGARDITVTENGEPVSKLTLASSDGAPAGEFGTILVIDASASMHGAAIRSAVAAARDLARQRRGAQQIGVIVFNNAPKVLLLPTDDQRAIDKVLSAPPPLSPQTHIFDAVGSAMDLLRQAKIATGSIVVLSDGADTGSTLTPDAIAKRAGAANISIYSIGLRSRAFDNGGLKSIAAGGGRYIAAESVTDLRAIFRGLGAELASDYLLRWRSLARPGSEVTIAVRVAGVEDLATSTYRVPGDATFVQIEPSFWTSTLGVLLTGLLCAVLLALALGILLVRRVRGPRLRERVSGFVSMPSDISLVKDDFGLTDRPQGGAAERSLAKSRSWARFKGDLEIARITVPPMRIAACTALATVVVMYLLAKLTGIALIGIFAFGVPWGVRTWVNMMRERQRDRFTEQLPDMLQASASAIRAGHGLVAALSMVAEDAPEPSRHEFLRVVSDEGLGVPLEEALTVVQQRMNSRDVLQIALVAQIQREAGGNMAEVLDRITESLRQSAELRRMVKALTAQGRMSRWVVTALPLVLLLIISIINPTYMEPLFTTGLGIFMLAAAGMMMFIGSLVIGKIVNFQV